MLINHYTDHKQHTTQPEAPDKPSGINSCRLIAQQVLNVNPTACLLQFLYPTQKTHPHPPPTTGSVKMQAQETHTTKKPRPMRVPNLRAP